jgi:hypothetical protein
MEPKANATAPCAEWLPLLTRPIGEQCFLLTRYGVAVKGIAPSEPKDYVAWAPLPRIPSWARELMQ